MRAPIATLFVNPTQFGPNEDLAAYPRDEAADRRLLGEAPASICSSRPTSAEMYPQGFATTVSVAGLTEHLCGPHRPGHFAGVATVVTKLLQPGPARSRLFRREGFPAAAGDPPHGARSRHPRRRSSACRRCARPMASRCRRATAISSPDERQKAATLAAASAPGGERCSPTAARRRGEIETVRRGLCCAPGFRQIDYVDAGRQPDAAAARHGRADTRACSPPPGSAARGSSTTGRWRSSDLLSGAWRWAG